jgi:predicted nuclease of predicted toxin-antitoxin system
MSIFASIYTDEDVAKLVSTLLKSRGINATNTPEQRKISATDADQLAFAASIRHCILTHNRVDFESYTCNMFRRAEIIQAL